MSAILQLDFFETPEISEKKQLREEFIDLKTSVNNVRKGIWAESNRLKKETMELKERLDLIERYICLLSTKGDSPCKT